MKKRSLFLIMSLLLAGPLMLAGCGSDSGDLPVPTDQVELSGVFAGPDSCVLCHLDIHSEWKDSWHTLKATYGPAFEGQNAGLKNVNPWTIENWDKLLAHMILDQVGSSTAENSFRDANRDELGGLLAFRNNDLILTADTFDLEEDVAIVVGATRKQRYAVYYDGSEVESAYLAYTRNGGIRYEIMTEETWAAGGGNGNLPLLAGEVLYKPGDPSSGTPKLFTFPGNKDRAGYNFLFIEVQLDREVLRASPNNYSEHRSWQERCIGCHTTGFDPKAWNDAKEEFKEGERDHLKDLFIADIRISCESCHGPGARHARTARAEHIIHPDKLTGEHRKMVCEQCHTRTNGNTMFGGGANDNRGFVLGEHVYTDVMDYVRPAWGEGSRAVSADGKGRRDHQQDMDIRLSEYIHLEIEGKQQSFHGGQACFDCHNAHGVGSRGSLANTNLLRTTTEVFNGTLRLKDTRQNMCANCHGGTTAILDIFNGAAGWPAYGNDWDDNPSFFGGNGGRSARKSHVFSSVFYVDNGEIKRRSLGLEPEDYIWAVKDGVYNAIWPWEVKLYTEEPIAERYQGYEIVYGPKP
ncbi:cytochrome c family protein [Geoalkalibacter halelectricus]|uniref:Cytochrome c family protein n=1 Tax=Geoalkalibacter halelectricus TaxID=2847045 RepID=A0ABY5ZM50_9BACT|nr:cytochrome c family protein [Geoalkalibacter halelectricus]UWZ80173.1 cytochrome c family protein [Geoalkalibacter halelectricus]